MKKFYEILERGTLDNESEDIWNDLLKPDTKNKNLSTQEFDILDYKAEFPFSMSDSFGVSIIRLAMGFYNSFGGFIVFGVEDKNRSTGKNSVVVDIERLNKKVCEVCSTPISMKHYSVPTLGIDIVLVPKRARNQSPAYLKKDFGKYLENTVWFRQDQQVLKISGNNAHFIFSDRSRESDKLQSIEKVTNWFPASRATIEEFVGRIAILVKLHEWLLKRRGTAMYLWGRGGSGKTKIAYEFAEILRLFPEVNLLANKSQIDRVIFLSAKKMELNSHSGEIIDIERSIDFSSERELIEAIILNTEYSNKLTDLRISNDALEEHLFNAVKEENIFLVLDDVDTISTDGKSPGIDIIIEAFSYAGNGSKVLITQRNKPNSGRSQKVPGFSKAEEYNEFVKQCCEKFEENNSLSNSDLEALYEASEGIPLITETIIGLRKSAPNWIRAIESYNEYRGEAARKYLHSREYHALKGPRSKFLLLGLSLFKKPASFEDLKFILKSTDSQLEEALSEAASMFINRIQSKSGDDLYVLTETATHFLREVAEENNRFATIKERYKLRITGKFPDPKKELSDQIKKIQSNVRKQKYENALRLIEEIVEPKFINDIHFIAVKALYYSKMEPANVPEARRAFSDCMECGHFDLEVYRSITQMESDNERHNFIIDKICPFVIKKAKDKNIVSEFYSKSAYSKIMISNELLAIEEDKAIQFISESIQENWLALKNNNNEYHKGSIQRNIKASAWKLVEASLGIGNKGQNITVKVMIELGKDPDFDHSYLAQPLFSFSRELWTKMNESSVPIAEQGFLVKLKTNWKNGLIRFSDDIHNSQFGNILSKL